MYVLSQQMGVRPSELAGITNTYEAYCFDEVVIVFGMEVSHELDKVGEKPSGKEKRIAAQRQTKLNALLDADEKKRFATPVATR